MSPARTLRILVAGVVSRSGCGGFDCGHLSVVVVGEQDEAVSVFGGVVVDGGDQDLAVVVEQDPGVSVVT